MRSPSMRFRFSTLLLLITVMAMGIALFLSQRRERRLRAENVDLYKLVGRPIITDPTRIAVGYDERLSRLNLARDPLDAYRPQVGKFVYQHRFWIYRPPNRKLTVRCAFGDDNGDLPKEADDLSLDGLEGDELMLDIVVQFDRVRDLDVSMELRSADLQFRSKALRVLQTGAQHDHWIFAAPYGKDSVSDFQLIGLAELPLASEPDTPLLLLGYSIQLNNGSPSRNALLVWIEDDISVSEKTE